MGKRLSAIGKIPLSPFRWLSSVIDRIKDFLREEPEDTPLPDVITKTVNDLDGFLYHLDALRKHLLRAVLFMALTTAFSFIFARRIIDLLSEPIGGITKLQAIDPTEPIGVFMRVSLLSGFALALPYIAFELWLFVAPGIRPKARIYGLVAIPAIAVFFIGGALFAYFIMLPTALPFLLNFITGLTTVPRPSSYIAFVTSLLFWVGIAFEFPLVIYVLAAMGIMHAKTLLKYWRIAVVIIAILAAVITPTVDPISMSLVMGPMILLYFLSIGLAILAQRGRT